MRGEKKKKKRQRQSFNFSNPKTHGGDVASMNFAKMSCHRNDSSTILNEPYRIIYREIVVKFSITCSNKKNIKNFLLRHNDDESLRIIC